MRGTNGLSIRGRTRVYPGCEQQYAKKHKYKPNSIALSLLNKKTKAIGVIIPTLLNHFFVKIFSGIEQVANENGYNIIIMGYNNLKLDFLTGLPPFRRVITVINEF